MSVRTWVMMTLVLGLCWGGFVAALIVGMRQQARRAERLRSETRPAETEDEP